MSAILDKLLKGQKVEWLPLGEACEIADNLRKPVKSSLRVAGNIPYYGANNIQDYVEGYTHNGEYVLIAEDGSANLENYSIQWATGKFWANNHVHVVKGKENLDSRFLYHFLRFMNFIPYLTGGDRAKLTKAKMVEIPIPIPPLDVQAEIVRILDAFTAVTAELTAELNMREKQYQYYRDKLLSFSDVSIETDSNRQQQTALCERLTNNVKQNHQIIWKNLGEVVKMQAGKNIKASQIHPSQTDENLYPCFGGNGIRGYVNNLSHQGEYVIIGRQGALCGNVQRVKGNFYATEHAVVVTVSDLIDVDWAYHMLSFMNLNQYASKSAQPGLAVGKLEQLEIPVPNLSEQKRVAKILDKLDTITHSITEGLPKEITLRKQQYEYYREQLIDFPRN